jgi:hypothetical protein
MLGEQAAFNSQPDRGFTRGDIEFGQDCGDVMINRAGREVQAGSDLGVPQAPGHLSEDFQLAGGEAERILARGWPWPTRDTARPRCPQFLSDECRRRARA